MGTISPELVLVDPDLAGIERARLVERARLEELISLGTIECAAQARSEPPHPHAPQRHDALQWPRHPRAAAVLGLALFAGGVSAAVILVGGPGDLGPQAAPATSSASPTAGVRGLRLPATKAIVEQEVLALVTRAPARSLSAKWIDRTTGLAENNLQVTCHRGKAARSFLCVIGLQGDRTGERVRVRYQLSRDGHAVVTWGRLGRRTPVSPR